MNVLLFVFLTTYYTTMYYYVYNELLNFPFAKVVSSLTRELFPLLMTRL